MCFPARLQCRMCRKGTVTVDSMFAVPNEILGHIAFVLPSAPVTVRWTGSFAYRCRCEARQVCRRCLERGLVVISSARWVSKDDVFIDEDDL